MSHSHETQSKPPTSTYIFWRFIVNNRGSILGVIGITLAIYFYTASKTSRDLIYFVHPGKTAVVRTGQSSKISVQLEGRTITEDLTATRIAIWNNGQEPVREHNLLGSRHLLIMTGSDNPIIDAKILKVSREEVVKLTLDQSEGDLGQLKAKWDILEHRDWAVLQLIYFGDSQTAITVSATVEQQGEIRAMEYGDTIRTPDEQYQSRVNWHTRSKIIGSFFVLISLVFMIQASRDFAKSRRLRDDEIRSLSWWLIRGVTILCYLALGFYFIFFWSGLNVIPPFDF